MSDANENVDDMTGEEEHMRDSADFGFGDARRCPRHPHVKTSSDDGTFDGVCGPCEADADDWADWSDARDAYNARPVACLDNGFPAFRAPEPAVCRDGIFKLPCYVSAADMADAEIPF